MLALSTVATFLVSQSVQAANTADNVNNGSTDLTLAGSYVGGVLPTTTSDVTFTNVAYSPAAFTLNSSLSIGTLNDLSTTALTIQNTSGTADTLTLNTAANSVSGTAADLLYVATGGNLSLGGGAGNAALNLMLAVAGNFDIAGTGVANISSAISASGLTFSKTGTGTLTLAGNGSSTFGSSTTGGTIFTVGAGTTNFGVAGTDAPSYTITGNNTGVYLTGGNLNLANGTITSTENQGLVIAGSQTYSQTGGNFTTNGIVEFANNGGASVVNVSAGTLTASGRIELAVRGNSTTTLSGTGAITTSSLVMTTTQLSGGAAGSIFNLNGGTLTTGSIVPGTNGTTGAGTVFNFNGGTLTSSAPSTTFMQGLTSANVLTGGAVINTGANNDTINQNLLASTTSTGGGLTKQGSGTLILGGTNTYTGANVIQGGTLGVTSDASLGAVPTAAASNIQFTATGATLQDTTNNVTLSANRNITIPAGGTTTLDSSTNAFTVGGAISVTGSVTGTTLALNSGTGGVGDLTGTVTDSGTTGGLIISKTGAGAFTFGGSNTSTLAKGQIQLNAGTFNFGSATEAPTLNLNGITGTGGNVGLYVKAGTFNMVGGTLVTSGTQQGLVVQGTNTAYNQTGGLLSTNSDLIEFANSGTTTQSISGGELRTAGRIELNVNGTSSTTTVSGTGLITTPTLVMLSNQTNNTTSTSTFNLNTGGTLATGSIVHGTSTGAGATTFNFNGGTLKASAASTTFLQGITAANVQAGGAVINTNGFNDTIGQSLLTGTAASTPDGGLTKTGAGILTLAAANTYTGPTTLSVGALTLTTATALSDTALLSIANGTTFNLNNATGGTETVGSLILGGTAEAPGTYNVATLTGFDSSITFGSSAGETLTVAGAVPEPSTWTAGLACIGLLGFKLRRRFFARL